MSETKTARKSMSVAEAGRLGGQKTAAERGHEFYVEIGKKGGKKLSETRGRVHFEAIGKKGGARVKELCAAAKAAESATDGDSE